MIKRDNEPHLKPGSADTLRPAKTKSFAAPGSFLFLQSAAIIIRSAVSLGWFILNEARLGEYIKAEGYTCIQNMLLAAHGLGLGAVWLGEILKNDEAVRTLLGLPKEMELMAVVALGHPMSQKHSSNRKAVSDVLLKEL